MPKLCAQNKVFSVLFLLSLLFFANALSAQRLPTPDVLTVDDGLCFRHVNSITQDKDGLMWFGTANGLSRYDGYRFLNFGKGSTADMYFPANEFAKEGTVFLNDSTLWSIVDFKLFATDIYTFETNPVPEIAGEVVKLLQGKKKDIWLVSNIDEEQFLWHFTEGIGFKKVNKVRNSPYELTDLEIDTSGHVWWSTTTGGMHEYSPGGELLKEVKLDSFLWFDNIMYYTDFLIDSRNRFFYFSRHKDLEHEIWQYFPENGRKALLIEKMENIIFVAFEDSRGDCWFVKEGGLLQLQSDGQLTDYSNTVHQALDFALINVIYEDRSNVLWIGTDGGLLKIPVSKQLFGNHFSKKTGGWGNAMRGICEDPKGDLFFFCEMGDQGLHQMNRQGGQTKKLNITLEGVNDFDLLGQAYSAIFDAQRNCLWTLNKDLLKIDLEGQTVEAQAAISFDIKFPNSNPLALLPNGQLLAGKTLDKLALYDPDTRQTNYLLKKKSDEYSNTYPKVFLTQGNDSLWVGTQGHGLFLFNSKGDLLKHYHTASQPALNNDHVVCLYLDEQKDWLWIGTFGSGITGINLQTGELQSFNQQNGLPDNNVASILGEGENLWLGTYNGLSCFNKKEETFLNFFEADGLTHHEFNFSSAFKSSDGKMYFGGMNGINSFYPQDLLDKELNPPLKLVRFTQYNERLDLLIDFQKNDDLKGPFVISPDISFFQFDWTLPNYFNPDKSQYFTWMEGLDKDWQPIGNSPNIRFNKLPPGDYILHIKGKDNRGKWSEKPIDLKISVVPIWWKRWWANVLFLLLAGGTILFFRKRETQRIKLQNQSDKEHLELERLQELDQAKSRFLTNISHEFRTPLTVILGMSEEIEEPQTAKQLIRQSGQNLLRLVNQLLDFGKLDAGKLKLQPQSADLVPHLQYMLESFHSLAEHKNVQLVFESGLEQLVMDFDEEKIQHIVSNLLSNAIKFTPRSGQVVLSLIPLASGISIQVKDTGIGIAADQLPRIFERYFQIGDPMSKGEPGTGIGLAFTKELVELMDGEIAVHSKVGIGTVFTVLLPVLNSTGLSPAVPRFQSPAIVKSQIPAPELPKGLLSEKADGRKTDKPHLLLVEDNPDVVGYIRTVLHTDYDITVAENGVIGIEKAIELIPDIIISDVMMPIKDGLAVTQFLKNDERTSHIPIVLLTAKADVESRLAGLERGADAYLAKPFNKKELRIRLEQLLELRRKLQARYAQFAPPQQTDDIGLQVEDAFLQKVNGIIEDNLSEAEFSVNELSEKMLMSRSQLFRKLKALTGKSIVAYLRSARLHKAKELLQTGAFNISEVAFQVGFNDPLYFSRAFSQEFGYPPTNLLK